MAAQIGQFALALAFVVTAYSIIASLLGIRLRNDNLIASGRNACLGTAACITTAIICLSYLFAVSDFSIRYIAAHSNRTFRFTSRSAPYGAARKVRCCSGDGC